MHSLTEPPPGESPKYDWEAEKAAYAAAHPPANGESKRAARPPSSAPRTTTRTDDEIEAWCQAGIDDELDEVEADAEGTRNHNLNVRALRCFRLALLAGFELDDVHAALFEAAQVAGAVGNPHTDTEIGKTLRSALAGARKYGPADPPDELIHCTEVDAAAFDGQETTP